MTELEYTSGCTCDSLTIDGVETIDCSMDKIKKVLCKLVKNETDLAILQSMLQDFISSHGVYEDLGHCDCCGDFISNYKLKI